MAINPKDVDPIFNDVNFPKLQASLTHNGDMIVVRSNDKKEFTDLLKFAATLRGYMKEKTKPKEEIKQTTPSLIQKKEQEGCVHPEWKEFTVKKLGQNQGRTFKKCVACGKFEWLT